METQLLKTLLSSSNYNENKPRLKRSIFSEEYAHLYDLLGMAHAKYQHDLSTDDLYSLWIVENPVATNAEKADTLDLIEDIRRANSLSDDVATDVIEELSRRELGREITNLGINLAEGDQSAFTLLTNLIARTSDNVSESEFGDPTDSDLEQLLQETSNDNRWQFNIRTVSRHVHGIGDGEFMILMARPETGKTAFLVSIIAGPDGFCEQGAKVLVIGNEEKTSRTLLRMYSAASGMTREEIVDNPEQAIESFNRIKDNLVMKDAQEWDLDKVSRYCSLIKPDVLVIDQADKIGVSGQFNASHEKLRELYRSLRELAKLHNCALIGVSQASVEAEGKSRVDFSMLEGSKTGKAAEADLIVGIGKHSASDDDAVDYTRFINISKNKLSGYHGCIPVTIEPYISRYTE